MKLSEISVKQPVLVNLLVVLTLVSGGFAYWIMPKERFPSVAIEIVTVMTVMPGASPKEIEQLITIPLEEEIAKVEGIDEIQSSSNEGVSQIMVILDTRIESIFEKVTQIQNQVEKVKDLPDEAEKPVVEQLAVAFETISICLLGDVPEHEVKEFAEKLEDDLKLIDGIEEVDIQGLREREIWVEVNLPRLEAYDLSLNQVIHALRQSNVNLPGGPVRMGRTEYAVRTEAEFKTQEEIGETILKKFEGKGFVYLKDVASIRDTFAEPESTLRIDGEKAVMLVVKKNKQSNAITLVKQIKEHLGSITSTVPAGMSISLVDDGSIEIENRLTGLYWNLAVGLVLVLVSFTFFIGIRAGLMVAAGIPVAFFGTFIFMQMFGHTINVISLFSLVLVLGLVVDDSIVVCENIYRHMENGMSRREAAVLGTEEIFWPVLATVLTTIAAFLPLLMMVGVLGKVMSVIPIVVSLALAASLVECLFILPSHVAEFGGDGPKHHEEGRSATFLHRMYEAMIAQLIRWRYVVFIGTIVAALLSVKLAASEMDFILFGGKDLQSFAIKIEGPPSSSLEETDRILQQFEDRVTTALDESPDVQYVLTRAGRTAKNRMENDVTADNIGEVSIRLELPEFRKRNGLDIKAEVRDAIQDVPGAKLVTLEDTTDGPPVGRPILVRVRGDDFSRLQAIAGEIKDYLGTIEGVKDINDDFPTGRDEIHPIPRLDKLAEFDLDVQTVATEIRASLQGIEATTVHDGEDEIDVVVRLEDEFRGSFTNLRHMTFQTPKGRVPFQNIATLERTPGFARINHHNQKRVINVQADVVPGVITSQKANDLLAAQYEDFEEQNPGYSLVLGGEYEDSMESLASMLRAFVITMILVYVILGGLFQSFLQPFIVMFAVPFSFIGVIVGFYLIDEPLGMLSIIGIIALSGIVVNDSLILIDFINTRRREGGDLRQSIIESGVARLRPIILTSITTILGLLPMATGFFGVDPILQPMAKAVVWGLTFATVLTLVIIPCIYAIVDDYTRLVLRCPLGLTRARYAELKAGDQSESL